MGAILYHLLTLRPPFVGKSNREIVGRVLQEELVPPSDRAPSRQIPHELNMICLRAMARDQDERYPDATALANAVQEFIDAPSTSVGTPGSKGVEPLVQRGMATLAQSLLGMQPCSVEVQYKAYLDPLDPPEEREQLWSAEEHLQEAPISPMHLLKRSIRLRPPLHPINKPKPEQCSEPLYRDMTPHIARDHRETAISPHDCRGG